MANTLSPMIYLVSCEPNKDDIEFQILYVPLTIAFEFNVTSVKLLQSVKAPLPRETKFSGIVIEVNPVQPENAFCPIVVILFGSASDVNLLQSLKAPAPMFVTLLPIVTDVKPLQP